MIRTEVDNGDRVRRDALLVGLALRGRPTMDQTVVRAQDGQPLPGANTRNDRILSRRLSSAQDRDAQQEGEPTEPRLARIVHEEFSQRALDSCDINTLADNCCLVPNSPALLEDRPCQIGQPGSLPARAVEVARGEPRQE